VIAVSKPLRGHDGSVLRRFPRGYIVVILAALLGTLASVGVFLLALSWEYRVAESDFQNRARNYLQAINGELSQASTLLYTVRAYFEANDHPVSRAEFARFASDLHDRVVGLRDIGWAPRVTHDGRDAFERDARTSGQADFQIMERGAAGKLVRAGERPEYYPIFYLDSGAVTQPVFGFDLASEPTRRQALARTIEVRRPSATPPVNLITVKRPRGGVMSFMSVHADGAAGKGADARGVVLGAIEIDVMMENIIADRARLAGIDVYLFEPDGTPDKRLIYWRSSISKAVPAPSERVLLAGTHRQGTVSMLDQEWGIVFAPSEKLGAVARNWHAIMPLVVGLLMTAMIVAYLLTSQRRTARLEQLTAELRRSSEDLRRNTERIAHMARHDALTGLGNRTLFRERMDDALLRLGRGAPFAVLCLDLDRFKSVNDSLGHGAGDDLLHQVAERLKACVREVDTVARLGGDEFAIILADTASIEAVQRVSTRLVDSVSQPYGLGGNIASIGLSVGIVMAPNDGEAAESLLARADQALYAAKAAGRGRCRFYAETQRPATATQRAATGRRAAGYACG
jgi:diguanylate cyclase (GGDEF)-like protein